MCVWRGPGDITSDFLKFQNQRSHFKSLTFQQKKKNAAHDGLHILRSQDRPPLLLPPPPPPRFLSGGPPSPYYLVVGRMPNPSPLAIGVVGKGEEVLAAASGKG